MIAAGTRSATEACDACIRQTMPLLNRTRDHIERAQAAIEQSTVLLRQPVYCLRTGYDAPSGGRADGPVRDSRPRRPVEGLPATLAEPPRASTFGA